MEPFSRTGYVRRNGDEHLMTIRFHFCDVFTDRPFGGNQLAVVPDAAGVPEPLLQRIAREFNFSETVFVYPPSDPRHTRRVRIFTPQNELRFAGHPTIGTAVTLAMTGLIPLTGDETRIVLEEGVGPVPVTVRTIDGVPSFAQLTAAERPSFNDVVPAPDVLAHLLSIDRVELLNGDYHVRYASVGFPFLIVMVKDRSVLARLRPNTAVMETTGLKEVFVAAPDAAAEGFHFRARMFAPLLGIPEDPATGSAAAAFAGYLAAMDPRRSGTLRWNVEQGVEMGRPSALYLEADKQDGATTAVRVGGSAVMMGAGELSIREIP